MIKSSYNLNISCKRKHNLTKEMCVRLRHSYSYQSSIIAIKHDFFLSFIYKNGNGRD